MLRNIKSARCRSEQSMYRHTLEEMRDDETGHCSRSKSLQFIHRAFGHWPSSGSTIQNEERKIE